MSAARARRIDPDPAPRPRPRAVPPVRGRGAPARPAPVRPAPVRPAAPRTRPAARPTTTPKGPARRAPLAVRLALVPVRIAILVASRITGGRPVLAAVLLLGCGIIALHAQTLRTNQVIADRELRVAALERGASSLRQEVSRLGATDRVSRAGRALGMVMPSPQGIGYVDARGADAASAARRVAAPSSTWNPAPGAGVAPEDGGTSGTGPVTGDGTKGTAAATTAAAPTTATPAAAAPTAAAPAGTSGTASTTGGATGTTGAATQRSTAPTAPSGTSQAAPAATPSGTGQAATVSPGTSATTATTTGTATPGGGATP